jgi:hypothetical protein
MAAGGTDLSPTQLVRDTLQIPAVLTGSRKWIHAASSRFCLGAMPASAKFASSGLDVHSHAVILSCSCSIESNSALVGIAKLRADFLECLARHQDARADRFDAPALHQLDHLVCDIRTHEVVLRGSARIRSGDGPLPASARCGGRNRR